MKAESISIHNFRSYDNASINLNSYSILVGANNSGKSNLIDAIRVFYEKDIKFDPERDFPKFVTEDNESWIEMSFRPSDEEYQNLKTEYRNPDGTFRVRKYLQSDEKDDEGKNKSDIYAYVNGKISSTRFYGVKNVQQGKFGRIIYIPAVSKLDDHTKLSGPSALRDLITIVLRNIIDKSPSYDALRKSCEDFGTSVKNEKTSDGYSLKIIESDITNELSTWGTSFEFVINPITSDDIVKILIGHKINDEGLNQALDPKCFGQGFQRNLIFTLIKLSSKYLNPDHGANQKDFSPHLTWILFEEPEAFLHPNQIQMLNSNLRTISENSGSQVLISTHNPEFISQNIEDIPSIIRVCRYSTKSNIGQLTKQNLDILLNKNLSELSQWKEEGIPVDSEDLMLDMESIKYSLWLDPRRCSAFFAKTVLLVEGPSEVALFGYLQSIGLLQIANQAVFFLDTIGKFNIHRFMNILGELKIYHAVIMDDDNRKYTAVDNSIQSASNDYTLGIETIAVNIEDFLQIPHASRPDKKPQHLMWQVRHDQFDHDSMNQLIQIINKLVTKRPPSCEEGDQ